MKAALVLAVALAAAVSTASASCLLQVGATQRRYDACEPTAAVGLQFFHTLEPGPQPGTTLLTGALKAQQYTGFAAFGWTETRRMDDTDAVVLALVRGTPVVDGYKIRSYAAAEVNAANGTLDIGDALAGRTPDGALGAMFTMVLPGTPEEVAAVPRAYNFVFGGSVAFDGGLAGHGGGVEGSQTQYGSGTITLQYAGGAASPAAAPLPEPVPSPVVPTVVPSPVVLPSPVPVPSPVTSPAPVATSPPPSSATISGGGMALAVIVCAIAMALRAMTEAA